MVQAGAGCILYVNKVPRKNDWCGKIGHWLWQYSWRRGKVFPSVWVGNTCVCSSHFCILGSGFQVSLSLEDLKSRELFHRNTEDFSRYSALHMLKAKNHPTLQPQTRRPPPITRTKTLDIPGSRDPHNQPMPASL